MPWERDRTQPRDQPPREIWVDDGSPLSRYDFLQIIVRGYTDMGLVAPEAIRLEYQALVAEQLAEMERRWNEHLVREFQWKPRPFKFTDVTNS